MDRKKETIKDQSRVDLWHLVNLPTDVQKCEWAYSVFMHRLLRKSHTRNVLSSLAVIMYLPPGWNTMPRTQLS
jgi:hypothetical protein